MASDPRDEGDAGLHEWERELRANYRWRRLKTWFPDRDAIVDEEALEREHARLRGLWEKAQPLPPSGGALLHAIRALEICNWQLEESIMRLCRAIGSKTAPPLTIGHHASLTEARWRIVWAYYLALRRWLLRDGWVAGYEALLPLCDPDGAIQQRVRGLLGDRTPLKQLYVERFCLNLEYWLGGNFPPDSPQWTAYTAAVAALETEILARDPATELLDWMRLDGGPGGIEICHHKAFRRVDIQLSSIGVGRWRGAMLQRGTDGVDRAATLEMYLSPLEAWIKGSTDADASPDPTLFHQIHDALGEHDDAKVFLAAFLVSLLRSQQLAARLRGEQRQTSQGT